MTEMINAMAAQQHMYTAAAYGLEAAAYAQYPQYVAQVGSPVVSSIVCVLFLVLRMLY